MEVDQAGQGHEPAGVEDLGAGRVQAAAHLGDGALADQDVGGLAAEDPRALDDVRRHFETSWPIAGSEPPSSR
ncbi:hypothetical protein GCM10009735_54830 [Actinomadura chokoriensis]